MDDLYRSITKVQPAGTDDLFGREFSHMNFGGYTGSQRFSRSSFERFAKQNREILSKIRIIALMLLLALFSNMITANVVEKRTIEEMEPKIKERISAETFRTEQETISRMKEEYGINDEKIKQDNMDADAETLAIMLEAYAEYGNSDYGLYLIGCSAKNRQLSNKYPGDMLSVVSAPEQYMGWNKDRVPTAHTKQIAKDIEEIYDTLGAPMSTSFVHVVWTSKEVKLIDNMEKGVPTHTFYESDMKDFLEARNG